MTAATPLKYAAADNVIHEVTDRTSLHGILNFVWLSDGTTLLEIDGKLYSVPYRAPFHKLASALVGTNVQIVQIDGDCRIQELRKK